MNDQIYFTRRLLGPAFCLFCTLLASGWTNSFAMESATTYVLNDRMVGVTGKVLDPDGNPIAGATVLVKGTKTGVKTDADGVFNINVPEANSTIVVSYVGYKVQEVSVAGRRSVTITLEPSDALEEVVVIGYGTVKRKDLTGAVSSVKAEEIAMAPVANPVEALQGRVAGLDIARESGQANSGSSILLRGNRSLTAGSEPLYIIDGIPGNITNLNPNDIESIDILKDASSTAIYGSAGANGVFIITTKQAKVGRVSVNLDAYAGINANGRYPSALQQDDWLRYLEDAFIASNNRAPASRDELLSAWNLNPEQINPYIDNGQWVNWVDETLQTGVQQNYSLSVNGGTEKTQGFFSMGYNSTKGIYRNDQADLFTVRTGATNKITDWFKGGIVTNLTWRDIDTRPSRLNNTFSIAPIGQVYDEYGNINVWPIAGLTEPSLLADDIPNTLSNNSKHLNLTINPHIDVDIMEGLTFRSILGATLSNRRTGQFESDRTYMKLSGSGALVRSASYETALGYSYVWENILSYQRTFGQDHDLSATLVSSWAHMQNESSSSSNQGFLYDEYLYYSLASGTVPFVGTGYLMSKRMSVASRINYGYKGRYLLTLTQRTDGVSQLARRWDTFLAAAGAWRVSDESFMDGARDVLNELKFRASYGVSGNSGIDPYSTLTEVTSTGLDQINLGGGVLPVSVLTQAVGNPLLTWEKSYNFNLGLDFGLLNNRITGAIEWYDTDTRDVLYARSLPFSSGGFTPKIPYRMTDNIARMNNRGIEVTLTGNNILNGNAFKWNSTVTFAHNNEQVRSIDLGSGTSVDDLISLGLFMGRPSNTLFGYKKLGIWQTNEAADAAAFGLLPGDVKTQSNLTKVRDGVWVDNEGVEYTADNPYSISPDDRVILGQGTPKWTAGWQNTFLYKGFDLNIFTIARWGHHIDAELLGYMNSYGTRNIPAVYDYWTPDNPTNDYPRPYINRTSANHSNPLLGMNVVDASFVKIKNITLGYTLPENLSRNIKLSRFRVYATMHNPIIFTRSHLLKGMDPETGASDSFPLYRQMVFGVNMSF
ncbi:TonB-linked SusC/RagA family outer membrane protein [Sphingobacterium allocomposti]|uniref:TonB-linked SusC/RagA family outer membrane protein n=1 Tax=Sphingobacterium allocomposti TaxID=415956 RepID=A0A5S5DJK5_9SPHI|nr:TonB-dependent receptor [Sphingobacterium composti Yoo et al. 2007 non Ten et al. 2007]TYP95865.1 TonB-linked SusC/RagA family outer membrane protein [Sphingobacterium composti Yoo et al. 2007 non Ten et al. 2007]